MTWKGRDKDSVLCLSTFDLYTGKHGEIEAGPMTFARGVMVLRGGEDVNR